MAKGDHGGDNLGDLKRKRKGHRSMGFIIIFTFNIILTHFR